MRIRFFSAAVVALALTTGSCSDRGLLSPVAPRAATAPRFTVNEDPNGVRISEIHYDNTGADVEEKVEISAPAGTNLANWKLLLYNGNPTQRNVYLTINLSGVVQESCGGRGVLVFATPGLQNGGTATAEPDGLALINPANAVVEFLSYEGVFTAASGTAAGQISTNIGVFEAGTEAINPVQSLSRNAAGVWSGPAANTFGTCNDAGAQPSPAVVSVTVLPATATIVQGSSQSFTATALDAANQPIANVVFAWSPQGIVDANGLATGSAPGDVEIVARAPNGVEGKALLHVTVAPPSGPPEVRISEIHYDNVGTDAGEAIEVEGPAGFDLTGWRVVLYNGNGGGSYNTISLGGTIGDMCFGRGVVSVPLPANGIQNGSPDGLALVTASGAIAEFLSYEGSFAATNGPASGRTSTDIGVDENPDNSVPAGQSLQRDATGAWFGPEASSFGACNVRVPTSTATIVISELMGDPLHAAGGASWGEWFEVHNYGAAPVDMRGWTISSNGQPDHVIGASVVVPPGGFAVLGRGADQALNGGVALAYNYFSGAATTIFLDPNDRLELRDGAGARVDVVRWTATPLGVTRALRDPSADNGNADGPNWGYSTAPFGDGDFGTPGAANGTLTDVAPPIPNFLTFSGRTPADVPLPVGFQDQLFASLRTGSGGTVPTTFTWKSETPSVASIGENGVMTALAEGTAVLRATAADGTTRTYSLPTRVATASTSAQYAGNAEFGEPADADPSDDFIVRRPQYVASYNRIRGTPNWVSYDLEATHFGAEDRCDCFTFDPLLPASFTRYTTADYTGAGTFHGYGIDRGHLARSFDRTSASLDNAATFYFTNIVPQAADLNQGPWATMENELGDLARLQNKEVYIIAGVAGSKGTLKNEGKITIPASVWKVAVIMPRDQGLANVHDYRDLEVIAVIMPNDPGVRNVDWKTYVKTVDEVEALSGYDLLAALPDRVERDVESNTKPPFADAGGPYRSNEGSVVTLSAAGSVDFNGTITGYRWSFGDGQTATGAAVSHTFANDGVYSVHLVVTDNDGLEDETTTTVTVANVPPRIEPFAGAELLPGETYTASSSFFDPGADAWSATVDYGDGTGVRTLALTGTGFTLSHHYDAAGTFSVDVSIHDDDVASVASAVVRVITPGTAIARAGAMVEELVNEERLNPGNGRALQATLDAAQKQLERDKKSVVNQLEASLNTLNAMERTNRIATADAAALRALVTRVIASLSR